MFRLLVPATFLLAGAPILAQTNASYSTLGPGCPGTGSGMGVDHVVPLANANAYLGGGNVAGFTRSPARYQQIVLGSELPNAMVINALAMRWPNGTSLQINSVTIDLEFRVGFTTKTPTTLDTTFDNNFDSGPVVTVVPRANFTFPDIPTAPTNDPTVFQVVIPFANTFAWAPQPGRNLLVEMWQRGNSNGASVAYIFDAGLTPSMGRLVGPITSSTGTTDGYGYGYVMSFRDLTQTAIPALTASDIPQFGNSVPIRLAQARPSTVAVLLTGFSSSSWNGLSLPLNLGLLGAPICWLRTSSSFEQTVNVGVGGTGRGFVNVPFDLALRGLHFYNQFAILDPGANAFGFALSNAGHGVVGN